MLKIYGDILQIRWNYKRLKMKVKGKSKMLMVHKTDLEVCRCLKIVVYDVPNIKRQCFKYDTKLMPYIAGN